MKTATIILACGLVVCLAALAGCSPQSDSVSVDDRFLGSWKSTRVKTHRIMTFRANGSWVGEIRVEGRLARIIEKKEKVTGTWDFKDGILSVTPAESGETSGWKQGVVTHYTVEEIASDQMLLRSEDRVIQPYYRVRSQQVQEGENKTATISMKPIAVNLSKGKQFTRDRYLCIDLDLVLNEQQKEQQNQPLVIHLHPRVMETAIFFFSSLTYSEVSTIEKLNQRRESLTRILNPYLDGKLKELVIKNVVVTTRWENVEEFLKRHTEAAESGQEKEKA